MQPTPNFTFRLPAALRRGLERQAAAEGRTLSQILVDHLETAARQQEILDRLGAVENRLASTARAESSPEDSGEVLQKLKEISAAIRAGAGGNTGAPGLPPEVLQELLFASIFARQVATKSVTEKTLPPMQIVAAAREQAEAYTRAALEKIK